MLKRSIRVLVAILSFTTPVAAQVMLCADSPPSASVSGTSGPFVAAQCTLEASTDGTILVIASTSVNRVDTDHTQLSLKVGIDQPGGLGLVASERVVDIYGTTYLERQNTMATVAAPVVAGSHTLYYFAERVVGTATVTLYRPRIMAIFIPSGETNIRVCEGRWIGEYTTDIFSQTIVASCSLSGLGMGSALVSSDGWMRLGDSQAELNADLRGNQPTTVEPGTVRRLDVVGDTVYDGVDSSLATSYLTSLGPGIAYFYMTIARSAGPGTVSVMWPGLAALWVATGGPVLSNSAVLPGEWTTTTITSTTMLETTLNPAVDGYFLILATASISPDTADYTAHFMARIDSGDDIANRYVKINDTIDRNLALSDLVPVSAGSHTIRLAGGRYDTPASTSLRVRDGSLSVLFFPKEMVAIFGDGFETDSLSNWSSIGP